MTHLMIFGAGYSGKAIAASMKDLGWRIAGTTRSEDKASSLASKGIVPFLFDGVALSEALRGELQTVTHLVQSIAPGRDGDPLLRIAGNSVRSLMPKLEWIGYLSTVGVYGDHEGAWVDEESECKPVSSRSRERLEAESAWTDLGNTDGVPVAQLRLSGIYGPGRNALRNMSEGTARRLVKKDQVFNRIRVEDIGAATRFLVERKLGGKYNVTDHEPAPPQDVVAEAARLMGVEPPPEQPFETAELSPMARSFYGENKRVSNRKIRDLGFEFQFPDYRVSLAELWSGNWRG
ncbi:SDR family oxidoreductase [Rhizobiaceae bacterium n13]|uniref:SDR family oxidoreductase n=1 Tax=Ferirhizobium litorale TaxID=2927786 RepID=A0AAE3QJY0_9HYPH|nr:SDR family oxidoreductase [Fererhizobium litorale]MDI7864569.1 SDR family oxidoreductase [Fererhizobium litorale]MDI7924890.1 SDR family oxidoreductase [Fererhizobium litorale]